MLGKLIRYDLKSTTRFLIVIHIFLIIFSILGRIFLTGRFPYEADDISELLIALTFTVYIILFAGASFGTLLVIAVRFYKNLFSDEGYLTNTLPVTKGMHLLSKTLSGTIWCAIDAFILYLCAFILIAIPPVTEALSAHWGEFIRLLGFSSQSSFHFFLLYMVVLTFIGAVVNVVSIQSAVILGQLFNGHKVLGAVVSYFVLTTISSIAATILMGIYGLLTDNLIIGTVGNSDFTFASYMTNILNLSFALEIVFAIILYIISYVIMKKKINLS